MNKYLYWGPFPWEQDGGAVVNYYNIQKQYEIRPRDEYHAIPKVPEELQAREMPYVNFVPDIKVDKIPTYMSENQIPLLNIFHVGHNDFEKIIDPIHNIGGKIVLHQTIHWPDDTIMKSSRLDDIDCIVAPTNYAKKVFTTVRRLDVSKIKVIPHGVDMNRFRRRPSILKKQMGIRDDQKVILYSGRLGFWKGVHQIIPIIRPLTKEYDCVFIIRGSAFWGQKEGKALHDIFTRMSKNNPNLIYIPEWQPPSFMEELYSFVDMLIFNSAHEGFGVPLIEAMSVGAVPIATSIANHIEILGNNGDTGILVSPTEDVGMVNDGTKLRVASSDQLYGAIKYLLETPELLKLIGKRGMAKVYHNYRLDLVADQWLKLYDTLIPEKYSMDEAMKERLLKIV